MAVIDDSHVPAQTLSAALSDFEKIVGADSVIAVEDELRAFRDPFQPPSWDVYTASAVVSPTTVEQLQAIVRVANERKLSLWTHGQGKNNGYGGPAPRTSGSVIISLRKMNRVLEINEELGYAVVEPGVRWFDLYEAIKVGGHKLWLSCADLGWGSVIGNSLDNGVTYLPYGADFAAPCGLEVVLANGEVLRTGMGAMPGNESWHVYKRGLGPVLDPLFMQSNFGIVTRMGLWLLPQPQCYMPLWIRAWKDDDLGPLIDTFRELMLDRTIEGVPQIINTLDMAAMITKRTDWYDGPGPIPDSLIDTMAQKLELGRWIMRLALYGDEAVVDHRFAKIKAAFERIPGVEVEGTKHDPDTVASLTQPAELVQAGVPNLDINHMTGWYGGDEGGHIGFSPVAPMTGKHALALRDLMRGIVENDAQLDYQAAIVLASSRSFIHVTMLLFDTKDEAQCRRAYDTSKLLVREAAKHGYGEYRAHLDFMDVAADQYSFGDHAYRRFCETIKDAVDPNGILAPGRHGIWPASMRNRTS
jgi:4-cresol dehydrogenase (hydroxylating)